MIVPWQVIGIIAGLSLAAVGHGINVLRLAPPDFRAGRGWFWAAALWAMVWSAIAFSATARSTAYVVVLAVIELAIVLLLVVGLRWIDSRERLHLAGSELPEVQATPGQPVMDSDWSLRCSGTLIDVKMFDRTETRYAIAEDVTVTNRSDAPTSISAMLWVEWGSLGPFPTSRGVEPCERPVPRWDDLLTAFRRDIKRQLIFPLYIGARQTIRGHIAFAIPLIGVGVNSDGEGSDDEKPRDREYRIAFEDKVTFDTNDMRLSRVYAPPLDDSGVVNRTDLATAGNASIWRVPGHKDDVPPTPEPDPDIRGDSIPDEDEIKILQMFVEFIGKHTSEDVAKRMSISEHMAEYHLDRLKDVHLITRSHDEYRNGHEVYRITREGRDLLVHLKLIK